MALLYGFEPAWGAVPGLLPVRFPRPHAGPAAQVSRQRALGVSRSGVAGRGPSGWGSWYPVRVPGGQGRGDAEQFDPARRRPVAPAGVAGENPADVFPLPSATASFTSGLPPPTAVKDHSCTAIAPFRPRRPEEGLTLPAAERPAEGGEPFRDDPRRCPFPRFSPSISPASARTRVWREMVGWLLPRGFWRWQLQTSPWAATIGRSRSRTGPARAASTDTRPAEPASDRGTSVSGGHGTVAGVADGAAADDGHSDGLARPQRIGA